MIKIVIICIACIWLCTTWLLVESTFPFPPAKDVFVVLNVPDLVELLEQPGLQHRHIVSFLTPDIGHDPYITLYMGLLLDLLEDRDAQDFAELEAMQSYDPRVDAFSSTTRDLSLNTTVVIFQANSSEITIFEAGLVMLSVLPATSTFISIQHGSHQIGLQHLQRYQSLLRLPLPSMLMHFNHERPWIVDYSMHLDFTFPSVNRLQEEYGKYDVVVRSYFFEPVTGTEAPIRTNPPLEQSTKQTHKNKDGERKVHAHYLPIFAPYQKHIVENISSSLYREAIATKASQRPFKCWFKGRINYDYDQLYDDEIIAEGVEGEVQNVSFSKMSASERYRATSSAEYERQVLIDLLQHHPTLSSTCTMEVKGFQPGEVFQVEEHYHPYMEKLAKTVFSLCPSGNNPETFRLHEVCLDFLFLTVSD